MPELHGLWAGVRDVPYSEVPVGSGVAACSSEAAVELVPEGAGEDAELSASSALPLSGGLASPLTRAV